MSRAELIRALRYIDWNRRDAIGSTDWPELIAVFNPPNTLRAFHHMPYKPSVVFREGALEALTGAPRYFQKLLTVGSQLDYDQWLNSLAVDLRNYWYHRQGRVMPYGPSLKMCDLLLKGVACVPEIPLSVYRRLVWFLHVPLDSFAIAAIRDHIDPPLQLKIGTIPRSASMGFVKEPAQYSGLQEAIRSVTTEAGVPPIAFDILAWDYGH
jgi:hypothetical protein